MASEFEPYDDPSLKGLSRYFNNKTIRGRANVSMATFALLGTFFLYKKLFVGSKSDQSDAKKKK